MFADEARFGRMNRPRPCWAANGTRPQVASQLIREFVYLYGAVIPKDGTCIYLILPAPDTQCFQIFLDTLAKKYRRQLILPFVDGADNHQSDDLEVPDNVLLHVLPAHSTELNPRTLCGMNFGRHSSRTMPSNPWMRSMQSLMTPHSTSNATGPSSNPSHCSPTSSSQCDMEVVSVPS